MAYNFKSEEEVKEFLKNISIEYRFGCFSEKKPEVCHLLGDYLESIDNDHEKAFKVYKENCDTAKFAKSCYKCGGYLASGKGVPKRDYISGLDYFEKSCDLGEARGCFQGGLLATFQASASNPIKSFQQAVAMFERGCEAKNSESCFHLSSIFMEGLEKGKIAKDMKRCLEYSMKACDLDHPYACSNLSLMYKNGDGVVKDLSLSEKYKLKAKDIQDQILKQQQELTFQQGIS